MTEDLLLNIMKQELKEIILEFDLTMLINEKNLVGDYYLDHQE
jgi:hypothetical protein